MNFLSCRKTPGEGILKRAEAPGRWGAAELPSTDGRSGEGLGLWLLFFYI